MLKHIVVTGAKQVGKSTLVNQYLQKRGVPYAGYRTKRIATTNAGPIYALESILTGKKQAISAYCDGKIQGLSATFDSFGTNVVHIAMHTDASILLFDEIGRFERNSKPFLCAINEAFSCGKQVIVVLKKEELPHLIRIRQRKDICLLDLDIMSYEQAWEQLIGGMEV